MVDVYVKIKKNVLVHLHSFPFYGTVNHDKHYSIAVNRKNSLINNTA